VNGGEVQGAGFLTSNRHDAYDAAKVDDLRRRIAVEFDAGRPAGPLLAGATFPRPRRRWSRGYDVGAVDWFLDHVALGHLGSSDRLGSADGHAVQSSDDRLGSDRG
jgi:DivIVA domain-containing protein